MTETVLMQVNTIFKYYVYLLSSIEYYNEVFKQCWTIVYKKKLLKATTLNCIKNEIRNDVSYFSETDTDYIPK